MKGLNHIKKLLSDSELVHKGQKMLDFTLTDLNKTEHRIKDLIKNKNAFLFFWNPEYVTPLYIYSRINYLSKRFPDVEFIQIKMDGNKIDKIYNLDIKNQFFITQTSEANKFLTSKMPRCIIINNKGIVTNGFASISSKKLHSELKALSKH